MIGVDVQTAQCLEPCVGGTLIGHRRCAAGRCFSDRDLCIDAKQLSPGIDHTVAIAIQYQPAVVTLEPAGACAHTIGVVIEHDWRGADSDRFDAVRVEVNGQWIAWCQHAQLNPDCGQRGINVDALVAVQRRVGINFVEHVQLWPAHWPNLLDPSRQTGL